MTDIQVYRWRCAPRHLRTRRQLAAAGLRPNGQDIAGRIPFRRYGRPLVAFLFDERLAAPKRTATPAQRAALAKATRERQLRAAERRGIDRSRFDEHDGDLGPAWAEPGLRVAAESTIRQGNPMPHLTEKPADWTAKEWADYQQCEDEHQDLMSQVQAREDSYERDEITDEEYRNWAFDYAPLSSEQPATGEL